MLAASQKEQRLKFEVRGAGDLGREPHRDVSFNYHQEHFGHTFGIRTPDEQTAQLGLPGLWPGAHRHGAVQDAWLRARPVAREVQARLWPIATARDPQVRREAAAADPRSRIRWLSAPRPARRRSAWVEKNCYVDVWIELLHALGLEPLAMLAFTVAVDFEGDQWTFFKPSHDDLRRAVRRRGAGAHRLAAACWSTRGALSRGQLILHRGRRVLAARHGGHRLPSPAHQVDDHPGQTSMSSARASATSTTRATSRSTAEDFVNIFRVGIRPRTHLHAAVRGVKRPVRPPVVRRSEADLLR